jgi:hypothetical protein
MTNDLSGGTAHTLPDDMCGALVADAAVVALWQGLTPLARNEFICWVEDAKQSATRVKRIARTCETLIEGKRRPCCWPGCVHRDDKPPSRWQQATQKAKRASGVPASR